MPSNPSSQTSFLEKKSRVSWFAPIIFCCTLALLVVLFYVEENWRGRVAWSRVQTQLQAKGEILEWQRYLPQPPPDDQNLMKAPGMEDAFIKGRSPKGLLVSWPSFSPDSITESKYAELHFVTEGEGVALPAGTPVFALDELKTTAAARKKLLNLAWGKTLAAPMGNSLTQKTPGAEPPRVYIKFTNALPSVALKDLLIESDLLLEAQPARVSEIASNTFALLMPREKRLGAKEYLQWSDTAHAEFFVMIDEAFKRPECWLPGDYSIPFLVPIPDFVRVRTVAQMLGARAQAHILQGRADEAFREIQRIRHLNRIMLSEPITLVSAMINVTITGLQTQAVVDGFSAGVWREKHWRAFIEMFSKTDLLPPIVDSLRGGERAGLIHLVESVVDGHIPPSLAEDGSIKPLATAFRATPRGWADQNLAFYSQLMQKNIDLFALEGPIDPGQLQIAADEVNGALDRRTPFRIVAQMGTPNVFKARQTAVRNQTYLNEIVLASALELYRQKNGSYPESLRALSPDYLETIPSDLILGGQLRYQKRNQGGYALYSIGWNAKDDLGPLLADQAVSMQSILTNKLADADWVWRGLREE